MTGRPPGYLRRRSSVPVGIWRLPLSPTALRLYGILTDFVDDEGACWPSYRTILDRLPNGADERTVKRAKVELTRRGLLVVQSRFDVNGRQTSNNYWLVDIFTTPPKGEAGHEPTHPTRQENGTVGGQKPTPRSSTNYEVVQKLEEGGSAAAAAPLSHNGSAPRKTPRKTTPPAVVAATLPSRRIAFDPTLGAFTGIDASDRARWRLLAVDADLDYELVKAADHALNVYERDPVKNAAMFLSNWMKGAQRRIADGRQPKGAARAPDDTPWFGPNIQR